MPHHSFLAFRGSLQEGTMFHNSVCFASFQKQNCSKSCLEGPHSSRGPNEKTDNKIEQPSKPKELDNNSCEWTSCQTLSARVCFVNWFVVVCCSLLLFLVVVSVVFIFGGDGFLLYTGARRLFQQGRGEQLKRRRSSAPRPQHAW